MVTQVKRKKKKQLMYAMIKKKNRLNLLKDKPYSDGRR